MFKWGDLHHHSTYKNIDDPGLNQFIQSEFIEVFSMTKYTFQVKSTLEQET